MSQKNLHIDHTRQNGSNPGLKGITPVVLDSANCTEQNHLVSIDTFSEKMHHYTGITLTKTLCLCDLSDIPENGPKGFSSKNRWIYL